MSWRLLIVRHGATPWNAEGRLQGQRDVPLSEHGRAQAAALARLLEDRSVDVVYSSDLGRARETAEIIVGARGLPIVAVARLREMSFGDWEGSTIAEVERDDPDRLHAWHRDPAATAPPGGESLIELEDRVGDFLRELGTNPGDRTALVVTHAGPIRVFLCLALGLPAASYWKFRVDPGSLTELDLYPEGAILSRLTAPALGDGDRSRPPPAAGT
ncbi:MAG: alpha-ribazole phosphatase [Isosphaeraceae bacterium]